MKVAEYVAGFLATLSDRVYGVCGAGAMHLNDAIVHHPDIRFIPMHHEQAATFAAESDARVSNKIGLVHVTAGPGITNTVTGVACAWADSIPMLVLAGQVESSTLMKHTGLRQLGVSEVDAVEILRPITKYAVTIVDPNSIRFHLECAAYLAKSGKPGPVFIEIPLDVQAMNVEPENLFGFIQPRELSWDTSCVQDVINDLSGAKCPVLIVGNGVHLSGAEKDFEGLLDLDIPILTSWNASDLISSAHRNYIGRPGLIGDRAGNFAVQNADLVIAIGTRLSVPQTGHDQKKFAPKAKIILVDIDNAKNERLNISRHIIADAGEFIRKFVSVVEAPIQCEKWLARCRSWKAKYPVILPKYRENRVGVNSYFFLEELAKVIDDDAIIVTDVGTAFVGTMQAMSMTGKQRLFHTSGIAPMGYGLPAAIGASMADPKRQVVCICGDGGIMFNIQELQTIAHYRLPIIIFVMCNGGYMTMQHTQNSHFKRESVSSPKSGVSFPNFRQVAQAFNIMNLSCEKQTDLPLMLDSAFQVRWPTLCEIHMPFNQPLQPRVQSRMENGKFVPTDIADLWPYLTKEEVSLNMKPETEKGFANVVERLDEHRQEILATD